VLFAKHLIVGIFANHGDVTELTDGFVLAARSLINMLGGSRRTKVSEHEFWRALCNGNTSLGPPTTGQCTSVLEKVELSRQTVALFSNAIVNKAPK
jgi:hypothetical protein